MALSAARRRPSALTLFRLKPDLAALRAAKALITHR